MSAPREIPFHLVTGFLGAGKTSLVNRLANSSALANALVIVNEWGEIGLDHLLYERLEGEAVLLQSGCVCCALRGDLVGALDDIFRRRDDGRMPPISRIVLETTGLAEPAPILFAVLSEPALNRRLALAGVTTLVDAVNGLQTLASRPENARQIALADQIALAKSDLLPQAERAARLAACRRAIGAINPAAPIFDVAAGEFGPSEFLRAAIAPSFAAPPPPASHASSVRSYAYRASHAIASRDFARFLSLLAALAGPRLLRLKGLVALAENPDEPLLIHGVQHVFHAPRRLTAWPDGDRTTRIVLVVDDLPRREIDRLWAALTGVPQLDAPDLAALAANPLVPRGGGLLD